MGALAEGLAAQLTLIRPVLAVNPLVSGERDPVAEGLPALLTLIGLLSSVNSLVFTKKRLTAEHFTTFIALERLLFRMDVEMYFKVFHSTKHLSAFLALDEFLFPFVGFLVLKKGGEATARLLTLVALERPLPTVSPQVQDEGGEPPKAAPTLAARVGVARWRVSSLVEHEARDPAEGLPTLPAHERIFRLARSLPQALS